MPVVSNSRSRQVLGVVGADSFELPCEQVIFCLANSSFVVAFVEECRP